MFKRGDFIQVRRGMNAARGVACIVVGPVQVFAPYYAICVDEDGEEYETPTCEGEWTEGDGSELRVRMVGDDFVFEVQAEDCDPLDENDFCMDCGQMGCGHGRYDAVEE